MSEIKPLYWHQGLFLQPQHFQIMDQYQSSMVQYLQQYGQPYFWGVAKLQVQEAALSNRQFEILGGEFIFPDGTHTVYPGNAIIKPRSFEDAWVEGEKPFSVYLGLRKWNPAAGNVSVVESGDASSRVSTRYMTSAEPEEVNDLHGEGPRAQVKRLTQAVRIFWETEMEQSDNYLFLPIAQLERNGEEIRISRRHIPPCVAIDSSDLLVRIIKDVRDQVASRCRQLEEYKNPKEMHTMKFDIKYMVMLLALHSLNRYVPMLMQLNETRNVHPWGVYLALRQLVGELSTFSEKLSATGVRHDGRLVVPPYDHTRLFLCFASVHALIGKLLDDIIVGPEYQVRLEHDGNFYTAPIPHSVFDRSNMYWLMVETRSDPSAAVSDITNVAKLGTADNLTTLIARAIPGLPLIHHPTTPPGLPQRVDTLYFQIDTTNRLWPEVEKNESISLHWDNAPQDMNAEIIVLGG